MQDMCAGYVGHSVGVEDELCLTSSYFVPTSHMVVFIYGGLHIWWS